MHGEPNTTGEQRRDGAPEARGRRLREPIDDAEHGVVDDVEPEPGPDASDPAVALPTAGTPRGHDHVDADIDWVPSDEDDPDSGSGRTAEDDGGYLPGGGTGRPYGR